MTFQICVPLFQGSLADYDLELLEEADLCEIYVDMLNDSQDAIKRYIETKLIPAGKRVILTMRRPQFAEQRIAKQERLAFIASVARMDVMFDLDIEREQEELSHAVTCGLGKKLIASYHNYVQTPSYDELSKIRSEIAALPPAICKVSTVVQTEHDMRRLTKIALDCLEAEIPWVVSPMSRFGKQGRIMMGLLGSAWVYARHGLGTADGQMSLDDCASIRAAVSR
jgi:3-dehydroquinate dehydratase type I